jgi:hypothetical protein
MRKMKFTFSLFLGICLLIIQVGGVFAAPALPDSTVITGTVKSITLETETSTGITTVVVEVIGENEAPQSFRIDQQTAENLALITLDADGNPVINTLALGEPIDINPVAVIPDQQESRHPVANALEVFFSDHIPGLDYDAIMAAHNDDHTGFGVIAQALWLTMKAGEDVEFFQALIDAKQKNDYSYFDGYTLPDGSPAVNWGQLKKALLNGEKKQGLGNVMSNKQNHDNGNNQDKHQNQENNKDKEKHNNGKGGGNGDGNRNKP